ncbi:serine O-acetyltransferase [Dorea sp. 210702-DFI.3.125]|uniref:serine O-acetyltransferase n=1 Tax=Dorea sp. 210702-DFI.3.125 TaxID=2883207 RepID=UPI001D077BF0|nr:serine acetyltransferase [Dorea sp. 210702-DFI.3.125]
MLSEYCGGGVIPYQAEIGEGTILGYQALGIVIHKRCVIGKNCHISQNVTMGGTSEIYEVPVLGDNVTVGAGANIIGPVHVGNNAVIGAGAVVVSDIPDNAVAVGVPAKVVKIID